MPRPQPHPYLIRALWQAPLWAIPLALCFGTLFGDLPPSYIGASKMALVFAYPIGLSLWALDFGLFKRDRPDHPRRLTLPVRGEASRHLGSRAGGGDRGGRPRVPAPRGAPGRHDGDGPPGAGPGGCPPGAHHAALDSPGMPPLPAATPA